MKSQMKKPERTVLQMSIPVICALCFLNSCGEKKKDVEQPVRPVKMMTIGAADSARDYGYPGKVKATTEATLSFLVPGRVVKLPIKRGQELAKGDLVARLDQRDFIAALEAAKAQYDLAKTRFASFKKLVEQGVISQDEFNEKKTDIEVEAANVRTAAKALDDSTLKAPFPGRVARKYIDNHQDVQAKQPVISLQDPNVLDIVIDVPESDLAEGKGGGTIEDAAKRVKAHVVFAAVPGREFKVKLKEFDTAADPETQTYSITFIMDKPEDVNIMAGMTATIIVDPETFTGLEKAEMTVPVIAVFADPSGEPCVWVVDPSSMTVHIRKVKVGEMVGGSIEILDGLKKGEKITTAGGRHLIEGMKVREYEKTF